MVAVHKSAPFPNTQDQRKHLSSGKLSLFRGSDTELEGNPHPPTASTRERSQTMLDERFEILDSLIEQYVREYPSALAPDSDTDRLLEWLQLNSPRDGAACHLIAGLASGQVMEFAALQKKLSSSRFQQLASGTASQLAILSPKLNATVRLNPLHVWAAFQHRLTPAEQATIPACMLFYQVGSEVRQAVLKQDVIPILRELDFSDLPVRTIYQKFRHHGEAEVTAVLKHLAELQIIGIG